MFFVFVFVFILKMRVYYWHFLNSQFWWQLNMFFMVIEFVNLWSQKGSSVNCWNPCYQYDCICCYQTIIYNVCAFWVWHLHGGRKYELYGSTLIPDSFNFINLPLPPCLYTHGVYYHSYRQYSCCFVKTPLNLIVAHVMCHCEPWIWSLLAVFLVLLSPSCAFDPRKMKLYKK